MILRTGLICVCLAGLSACVATPSGPSSFVATSAPLPAAQQSLRQQAADLDARFHEAGWVAEEHGAAMQRLTGMLMFGRGETRRTPVEVYFAAAGLEEAAPEAIEARVRRDLEEATRLTLALAVDSRDVLNSDGLTPETLTDDIGALEFAITDVRQAIDMFRALEEGETGLGDLSTELQTFELSFDELSRTADALAFRRRQLRASETS